MMKRLFLFCFVCTTFIGCNKPFTEEKVSDLAIKTFSAFEAEVKNPDNDLIAIVGKLCEEAGMEIDSNTMAMVDGAENIVIYKALMEEGPTFEIVVEDCDQSTSVAIGFMYPNDMTQGNGIPKKLCNNLISSLASNGMGYYTGHSEPKHINPITSIYSSYTEFDSGVVLDAGTIDKINANKPEDNFFLTTINALNCLNKYHSSYDAFETLFKQICENGGLSYDASSKIEMSGISNSVAYTTKIDDIKADMYCAESTTANYFGEKYKVVIITLMQSQNDLGGSTLYAFGDRLKKLISNQKYNFQDQGKSSDNSIIMLFMR